MSQTTSIDSSSSTRPVILVVDDEVAMVRSLELLFRSLGQVVKCYSVPEAEEELAQRKIDCIVTDVSMPEASGIELLDRVRKSHPDVPVVIMTAYSSVPEAVEAIQMGAFEYLTKPFENEEMLATVKKAIERKGLVLGQSEQFPTGWVCNSRAMKAFLERAEKLAQALTTVLIVGQKGVGKRRAARWILDLSSQKPSYEMFSSHELNRMGVAELAALMELKDALYIEEVFGLNEELQDFVFDAIRKGKRILASSSSSAHIQAPANFRKELFDRLMTHVLEMPNLEQRKEDFEALSLQILDEIRRRMKMRQMEIDPEALEKMREHEWVGNVRELERALERAVMESKTNRILWEDIPLAAPDLSQVMPFSIPVEEGWGRMEFLFKSLEKDLIGRALQKYPDKSNSQIASLLGTTRRILELRMKSYGLRGDANSDEFKS